MRALGSTLVIAMIAVTALIAPSVASAQSNFTLAAFGPQVGIGEAGAVVKLANEADAWGFDLNEGGWVCGFGLTPSTPSPEGRPLLAPPLGSPPPGRARRGTDPSTAGKFVM